MRRKFRLILAGTFIASLFFATGMSSGGCETEEEWPIAKGTFIQKELVKNWNDTQWQSEFDYLKEVGMEYVVFAPTAYSADGEPPTVVYDSDVFDREAGYPDLVENLLRNAEEAGLKVFLGLNYDADWFNKTVGDPIWLNARMAEGNQVASELYSKYKSSYEETFYGWYYVWEVDYLGHTWSQTNFANAVNLNLNHIDLLDSSMPFMFAPYILDFYGTPNDYKLMWTNIFAMLDLRSGDIFAPQDSVGAGGLNMGNFVSYFAALRQAVDTHPGLQFWSDAETFDQRDWSSASIGRFVAQLKGVQPYVDNIITFAYSHYYSPNVGKAMFHDAYKDYVLTGALDATAPGAPANLAVSSDYATVQLSWNAPAGENDVDGYLVYRDNILLTETLVRGEAYEDRTAAPLTTYNYEVSTIDVVGNESARSAATFTTPLFGPNIALGAAYVVDVPAHASYPDTNGEQLTDGILGTPTYGDGAWQGWFLSGSPLTLTVDLDNVMPLNRLAISFLQDLPVGVYLPPSVTFSVSDDNFTYSLAGNVAIPPSVTSSNQRVEYAINSLANVQGRYVKVEVHANTNEWLFIDEIEIR